MQLVAPIIENGGVGRRLDGSFVAKKSGHAHDGCSQLSNRAIDGFLGCTILSSVDRISPVTKT